jgi:DEAD/DEAH box helicase domain-containing protein
MDGWRYHKDCIGADIAKRVAVARSRKFTVWTLTADDIAHVLEPGSPLPETLWAAAFTGNNAAATPLYERFAIERWRSFHSLTAFEQLRARINGMPDPELERVALALALRVGAGRIEPGTFESLKQSTAYESILQSRVFEWPELADVGRCWTSSGCGIQLGVLARRTELARLHEQSAEQLRQPCVIARWAVAENVDTPDARRLWQQWWHALNVLLAVPNSWAAADHGTDLTALVGAPTYARSAMPAEWDSAASMAVSAVHPLLAELFALGMPAPVVGFELLGADQRVVAECELAWPTKQVAVTLGEPAKELIAAGWTAFSHDSAKLAERLVTLLK